MLWFNITQFTSYLKYNAPIKIRIHCLLQNITHQPTCSTCNKIVKMRTDGRYRYTFPTYCGIKCFTNVEDVKQKRKATNKRKYSDHIK